MKNATYCFSVLLFLLAVAGCSKTEKRIEITDQTYIIRASNMSISDIPLTIKTSLEAEQTFTIPKNSTKDIYIRAAAGEYVKFTVTKAACEYRILDSRGALIALYAGLPSSAGNTVELDFIAFAPADEEKDLLKYKTGLAKVIGDNLAGKPYQLRERYYLENGIKTDNAWVQESCTFNDEYVFTPLKGEFGNFNPELIALNTTIDKNKSSCSYGAEPVVPPLPSVFTNGKNTVSFPIWDRLAVDGPPSSMIYRELIIDSINTDGVLTLHREVDGKKEVFVYGAK